MRPGQQNKRGRGRGSNNNNNNNNNNNSNNGGNNNNFNRKGSNPLTRTYDSSGPDVKIRGTAQHIAEKYSNLARDSHSAGDRVMAENYLQHAEHYNRIIAAAQSQMQERFQQSDRQDFNERDGDDMEHNDGGEDQVFTPNHAPVAAAPVAAPQPQAQPQPQPQRERQPRAERQLQPVQPQPIVIDGTGPQPVIEGTPAEVSIDAETPVEDAGPRAPRRRGTTPRPRRQPRRAAGSDEQPVDGDGEQPGASDDTPPRAALADADTE